LNPGPSAPESSTLTTRLPRTVRLHNWTYSCLTYPTTVPTGASMLTSMEQQDEQAHQQQPAQHLKSRTMRITSCKHAITVTTAHLPTGHFHSERLHPKQHGRDRDQTVTGQTSTDFRRRLKTYPLDPGDPAYGHREADWQLFRDAPAVS